MEVYEQLGMTKEEYEQAEAQFRQALENSIRNDRRSILDYIKATFGTAADQKTLRQLSWKYLCQDRRTLLADHTREAAIASCPQDVYHMQHLTQALFLALEYPSIRKPLSSTSCNVETAYVKIEVDEMQRLENQKVYFGQLAAMIPKRKLEAVKRVSLQDVYDKLLEIEQLVRGAHVKPTQD